MVFPHWLGGFAAEPAPIPVYRWDLIKYLKKSNARKLKDKVATGQSPVAPTTLARRRPRLMWTELKSRETR